MSEVVAQPSEVLRDAYPQSYELLSRYVDILASRGIDWGLLGPREGDKLWSRHIANSLALTDVLAYGVSLADVGSGAGLPGLPIAITRPDLEVTLIEPLLRRATFLELAVSELGLADRVHVLRSRAEELDIRFDVVTCRAVASLDKLVHWTHQLFAGGTLLALKGSSAEAELTQADKRLAKLGLVADVLELRAAPGLEGTRAIRVIASSTID